MMLPTVACSSSACLRIYTPEEEARPDTDRLAAHAARHPGIKRGLLRYWRSNNFSKTEYAAMGQLLLLPPVAILLLLLGHPAAASHTWQDCIIKAASSPKTGTACAGGGRKTSYRTPKNPSSFGDREIRNFIFLKGGDSVFQCLLIASTERWLSDVSAHHCIFSTRMFNAKTEKIARIFRRSVSPRSSPEARPPTTTAPPPVTRRV